MLCSFLFLIPPDHISHQMLPVQVIHHVLDLADAAGNKERNLKSLLHFQALRWI